jgi:hypothetical protein
VTSRLPDAWSTMRHRNTRIYRKRSNRIKLVTSRQNVSRYSLTRLTGHSRAPRHRQFYPSHARIRLQLLLTGQAQVRGHHASSSRCSTPALELLHHLLPACPYKETFLLVMCAQSSLNPPAEHKFDAAPSCTDNMIMNVSTAAWHQNFLLHLRDDSISKIYSIM